MLACSFECQFQRITFFAVLALSLSAVPVISKSALFLSSTTLTGTFFAAMAAFKSVSKPLGMEAMKTFEPDGIALLSASWLQAQVEAAIMSESRATLKIFIFISCSVISILDLLIEVFGDRFAGALFA